MLQRHMFFNVYNYACPSTWGKGADFLILLKLGSSQHKRKWIKVNKSVPVYNFFGDE